MDKFSNCLDEIYRISTRPNYNRVVSCSPKNLIVAIGEHVGKAKFLNLENCVPLGSVQLNRDENENAIVTGCQFSRDGSKLICSTSNEKLHLIDVESTSLIRSYSHCTFRSLLKCGLDIDKESDYCLSSVNTSGRGVTWYDLRNSSPVRNIDNMHITWIPDLHFAPGFWGSSILGTICSDGQFCITDADGKSLLNFDSCQCSYSFSFLPKNANPITNGVVKPPENVVVIAGEEVLSYGPKVGVSILKHLPKLNSGFSIKFNNSGNKAFLGCENGSITNFLRLENVLIDTESKFIHSGPISDMAISFDDEYLVSTAEDGAIVVTKLQ